MLRDLLNEFANALLYAIATGALIHLLLACGADL